MSRRSRDLEGEDILADAALSWKKTHAATG